MLAAANRGVSSHGQSIFRYLSSTTNKRSTRVRAAPIKLTDRAIERISEMMKGKEGSVGVKIGVRRRGCNGYSYTMNYAFDSDEAKDKDFEKVEQQGIKVFIDPKAIFYIVGTEMDFEETELSSEFTFANPNAKGECGCGESFNV